MTDAYRSDGAADPEALPPGEETTDGGETIEESEGYVYTPSPNSQALYNPDEVAEEFVDTAIQTFTTIAGLKEGFFRRIYDDSRWRDCFDFQDESRRFSTFVRIVFSKTNQNRLKEGKPDVAFPSSTEANDWYIFFRRKGQFTARGLDKELLPINRSIQNTLQSATVGMTDEKEKVDAQVAILEKVKQEGLPVTAAAVRKIASEMGLKKPAPKKPEGYKVHDQLSDMDWLKIVGLIDEGTSILHSCLPPEDEHSKMLAIFRKLRDVSRAPEVYVFGCFDDKDLLVSFVLEAKKGYMMPVEKVKKDVENDCFSTDKIPNIGWKSEGFCLGNHLNAIQPMGEIPEPKIISKSPPPTLSVVVTTTSAREAHKKASEIADRLDYKIQSISLALYEYWKDKNPEGQYIDEILEPSTEEQEEN